MLVFLRRGIAVVYNGNEIADNAVGSIFMPNDRRMDRTRINWARVLQPVGMRRLAHIRALAKLRHENPVFADGTQEWITEGDSQGALAFVRRLGDKAVFVAGNLTSKPVAFKPGNGVALDALQKPMMADRFKVDADGTVRLDPYGFVVQEL